MKAAFVLNAILLLSFGWINGIVFSQTTATFWYGRHGEQITWHHQPDVFAFRMRNGHDFNNIYPPSIVWEVATPDYNGDNIFVLKYAQNVPDSIRQSIETGIAQLAEFDCAFDVVNQVPGRQNTQAGWSPIDDLILVTFRDPYISAIEIDSFCLRHELALERAPLPGLAPGYSHTFTFRLKNPLRCIAGHRAIDVCRGIWLGDSAKVMIVEPNLTMAFSPTTNDSLFTQLWHVRNIGQGLAFNQSPGTFDADHDIDRMWAQGLKGAGIRVAVLDTDGYDLGHEDMQGAFTNGWNSISNVPYVQGPDVRPGRAHGMCVAGIIGARADNQVGLAGVSPECQIVPILVNGTTAVMASGIQHATISSNDTANMVHVLNISMGAYFPFQSIQNELMIAKRVGRNGLGMVIVSAAGNDDMDTLMYPSAWPETISVCGNNPTDMRKATGDPWDYYGLHWGSTYNDRSDVAAACCLIWATDHSGNDGYTAGNIPRSDYYDFNGTSGASPITAGVCALLLQAYPGLVDTGNGTWQVRDALRAGAEKTYPNVYDYNAYPLEPGRSLEMGFGRLNGYNSLLIVGLGQANDKELAPLAIHNTPGSGTFTLFYDLPAKYANAVFTLKDMWGREWKQVPLLSGKQAVVMEASFLTSGIYAGYICNGNQQITVATRFVYQ